MELTHFDECSYQLELQMYQIAFLDFKYEPPNFIYVEIGTSNRTPTTPSMVQHVAITKLVNPLRGGTSSKIIPLHVQFFFLFVHVITAITKPMESSGKSIEEQVEHVDPSFIVFESGTEPLKFLSTTLPSNPTPYRYRSKDYFDY
jgi:hypothetical protein